MNFSWDFFLLNKLVIYFLCVDFLRYIVESKSCTIAANSI